MTRQCENLRITRYTVVARFSAQGLSTEYRKVVVFVGVLTGFMYLSNALTIAGSDPSRVGPESGGAGIQVSTALPLFERFTDPSGGL